MSPIARSASNCARRRTGVVNAAGETCLDFGAWHGDWSPWNMHAGGHTVFVWDWERFTRRTPVGFDALHHWMHGRSAAASHRTAPPIVCSVLHRGCSSAFGIGADAAAATTALYLVDVATRYLADRQDEAGQALGAVGTWMLPVLGRKMHRLR